jgi:hypothetical protein
MQSQASLIVKKTDQSFDRLAVHGAARQARDAAVDFVGFNHYECGSL